MSVDAGNSDRQHTRMEKRRGGEGKGRERSRESVNTFMGLIISEYYNRSII